MKRVEGKAFRCALCGRFASEGVTEGDPRQRTTVCDQCVATAIVLVMGLPDEAEDDAPAPEDEDDEHDGEYMECSECGASSAYAELDDDGRCWACAARLRGKR